MRETRRPRILGVLNLSPESMVTESIATTETDIDARAAALRDEGADWIDLGGRSITPDATMIDDQAEQARLGPALARLRAQGHPVSVDTWSESTARFALAEGAGAINYTGQRLADATLERIAEQNATLFLTFMPYENAYAMRSAPPARVGLAAVLDHLGPRVEQARDAGVRDLVIDPNLGIIHPTTDDYGKIHGQLGIVWQLDSLRTLGCPILLYAARKPERLARIMMASAVIHAGADYVRTHTPAMIGRLLDVE